MDKQYKKFELWDAEITNEIENLLLSLQSHAMPFQISFSKILKVTLSFSISVI